MASCIQKHGFLCLLSYYFSVGLSFSTLRANRNNQIIDCLSIQGTAAIQLIKYMVTYCYTYTYHAEEWTLTIESVFCLIAAIHGYQNKGRHDTFAVLVQYWSMNGCFRRDLGLFPPLWIFPRCDVGLLCGIFWEPLIHQDRWLSFVPKCKAINVPSPKCLNH